MCERCAVECVPVHAPLRHVPIHQIPKPLIVTAFDEVHHFVHKDVLEARRLLLHQFKIQPDSAGLLVARPPAGLHPLDADLSDSHSGPGFPFCEQRGQAGAKLSAVPSIEHGLPGRPIGTRANAQRHRRVVRQANQRPTAALEHVQPVAPAFEVMTFPGYELSLGLAILLRKFRLLSTDPPKARNHGQPDGIVVQVKRRGHPYSAVRR